MSGTRGVGATGPPPPPLENQVAECFFRNTGTDLEKQLGPRGPRTVWISSVVLRSSVNQYKVGDKGHNTMSAVRLEPANPRSLSHALYH